MNKQKRQPVAVGVTSLFAVLITLCLTVFAVLSCLTAQSELALAEKAADSVTAFYEAECRAVGRLAESVGFGTFTETIDENRELRVSYRSTENGIEIDEWAVVRKTAGGQ